MTDIKPVDTIGLTAVSGGTEHTQLVTVELKHYIHDAEYYNPDLRDWAGRGEEEVGGFIVTWLKDNNIPIKYLQQNNLLIPRGTYRSLKAALRERYPEDRAEVAEGVYFEIHY